MEHEAVRHDHHVVRPAVDHATDQLAGGGRRHRTPLTLRMRVRLRAATLDARLADGANPLADRSLCLRARQLLERPLRHRLAFTIDTIVRDAHAPLTLERARQAARLNAGAICAAEPDLRALAARLRDPGTVDERGMAMTSVLLRDGCGPLYDRSAPLPLTYCVRMALLCLDP
jgi:hypothetical protein